MDCFWLLRIHTPGSVNFSRGIFGYTSWILIVSAIRIFFCRKLDYFDRFPGLRAGGEDYKQFWEIIIILDSSDSENMEYMRYYQSVQSLWTAANTWLTETALIHGTGSFSPRVQCHPQPKQVWSFAETVDTHTPSIPAGYGTNKPQWPPPAMMTVGIRSIAPAWAREVSLEINSCASEMTRSVVPRSYWPQQLSTLPDDCTADATCSPSMCSVSVPSRTFPKSGWVCRSWSMTAA